MGIFKRFYTTAVALMLAACGHAPVGTAADIGGGSNLIVFYTPETGKAALLRAARDYGVEVVYEYKNFNGIAVRVPQGVSPSEAAAYFRNTDGVLAVNPDGMAVLH
ncbi:hypothetical protein [Neisseria animalis]|uniref:Uncharacterized protein n=1 Tax=Neisseria animalis TaxID=492 RepID=A0A5P3MR85_NEIAN|nr:hypothetical protein [Neisseria animalis]QEY23229.1 hypothetical protein D0T90_00800 [Neisseria animalis]ROW31803.1 hypothetical protein CGZ60_08515 [Neisseria animalis]